MDVTAGVIDGVHPIVLPPSRVAFNLKVAPSSFNFLFFFSGFGGLKCENNIDDCAGITCPDNFVCVDLVESHECRCPLGFTGSSCTEEIDYCVSSPCKNNGTCEDMQEGYKCECEEGWTGEICGEDVDECANNANLCNNGICQNTAGHYQCFCRPGFSGNNCNHEFDECLSHPCQNGGNCTNLVNNYDCVCPLGFNGEHYSTLAEKHAHTAENVAENFWITIMATK
jgi:hypothetical protein